MKKYFFNIICLFFLSTFHVACSENVDTQEKEPSEDNKKDENINEDDNNEILTIMPIGDSLTEESTPGYRGYLYKMLINAGLNVDFVGVKKSEPSNGGDPDHSGFGGFVIGPNPSKGDEWSSSMGNGNIYYHLDNGYEILSKKCSVITLMIGINDFFNDLDEDYNPENDGAKNLDGLISKIFALRPDVSLFVSDLTPVAWNMTGFAQKFNSEVPEIVDKYVAEGYKCYFVNMRNGNEWDAQKDIRSDQLHLTAEGYEKVAKTFCDAILDVYQESE